MRRRGTMAWFLPLALLASVPSLAQGPPAGSPPGAGDEEPRLRQEMRRNLANHLRAELGLTDEQTRVVLPLVESIENERTAQRRERRTAARELHRAFRSGAPDAELQRDLDCLSRIQDDHREKVKALAAEIDRSLTVRQRVAFRLAVARYARRMTARMRELRGPERGYRGGRGGGPEPPLPEDWP